MMIHQWSEPLRRYWIKPNGERPACVGVGIFVRGGKKTSAVDEETSASIMPLSHRLPNSCGLPLNSSQWAIGSTKQKRSAARPLLPPPRRAIVTRRLWFQLDECRGSEQTGRCRTCPWAPASTSCQATSARPPRTLNVTTFLPSDGGLMQTWHRIGGW